MQCTVHMNGVLLLGYLFVPEQFKEGRIPPLG